MLHSCRHTTEQNPWPMRPGSRRAMAVSRALRAFFGFAFLAFHRRRNGAELHARSVSGAGASTSAILIGGSIGGLRWNFGADAVPVGCRRPAALEPRAVSRLRGRRLSGRPRLARALRGRFREPREAHLRRLDLREASLIPPRRRRAPAASRPRRRRAPVPGARRRDRSRLRAPCAHAEPRLTRRPWRGSRPAFAPFPMAGEGLAAVALPRRPVGEGRALPISKASPSPRDAHARTDAARTGQGEPQDHARDGGDHPGRADPRSRRRARAGRKPARIVPATAERSREGKRSRRPVSRGGSSSAGRRRVGR